MKNILSYQPGTVFSGEEILAWAEYQVNNKTSHYKQGLRVLRLYGKTINPIRDYVILSSYETFGCDDWVHKPLVIRKSKFS